MSRRVVITGSGFVLPLGDNREDVLSALQEPHGPFLRSEADPHVAVCPVPGFDLKSHVGRCKNARYLTRGQQLCLAAAVRAVDDAGLAGQSLDRAGLFLGLGPNLQASPRDDRALWLLDYLPNTVTSVMAEILGAHGENLTILTACAASTQALGQAFRTIASGLADVALAGAAIPASLPRESAPTGRPAFWPRGSSARNWRAGPLTGRAAVLPSAKVGRSSPWRALSMPRDAGRASWPKSSAPRQPWTDAA